MKTLHLVLTSIVALLVAGCATPYQSTGFRGGFNETLLAPDVYRVVFNGNGYTSPQRAQDFALLRASELTLKHGFTHFAIVDESNASAISTITSPGYATTSAYGTGSSSGNIYINPYGANYSGTSTAQVTATTTFTPPQTTYIYKPFSGLLVKAFPSQPEGIFTFDAAFLQQTLKEKYRIK